MSKNNKYYDSILNKQTHSSKLNKQINTHMPFKAFFWTWTH